MKYNVKVSMSFRGVIDVPEGEDVEDAICDLDIPEDTEVLRYVDDSFEIEDFSEASEYEAPTLSIAEIEQKLKELKG